MKKTNYQVFYQVTCLNTTLRIHSQKLKNILFILMMIIFLIILQILLTAILTSGEDYNKESHYNPIPKNEDLEFTKEEHRTFAKKQHLKNWYSQLLIVVDCH